MENKQALRGSRQLHIECLREDVGLEGEHLLHRSNDEKRPESFVAESVGSVHEEELSCQAFLS